LGDACKMGKPLFDAFVDGFRADFALIPGNVHPVAEAFRGFMLAISAENMNAWGELGRALVALRRFLGERAVHRRR